MTGYHLFHIRSSKDLSSVFRISTYTPKRNASEVTLEFITTDAKQVQSVVTRVSTEHTRLFFSSRKAEKKKHCVFND